MKLLDKTESLLSLTKPVSDWFDTNWRYRRAITIRHKGDVLMNHPIVVRLTQDNFDFRKASIKGEDLRFTDSDGVTTIDHWIETYDADARMATVWVKLPALAASKNIYLYYGNEGAEDANDINGVFLLADDFETFFAGPLDHAETYLTIPTYDGQNQPVQPDVAYFPERCKGYKYWMAHTPFTQQSVGAEKIDVVASQDGQRWEIPAGGALPIVPDDPDYDYADPDIIYNSETDELWVYFLADSPSLKNALLKLTKSPDGVRWSPPVTLIDFGARGFVSPAVVRLNATTWYLFYVQSCPDTWQDMTNNFIAYRTSSDGEHWGPEQDTGLMFPGYYPWHVEVQYIPSKSEFWALAQVMPVPYVSHQADVLVFARGVSPTQWTHVYTQPAMERTAAATDEVWHHKRLYRSAFVYHPQSDLLEVWYSGLNHKESHVGYTRACYGDFLSDLTQRKLWTNIQRGGNFGQSSERARRGRCSAKLTQKADAPGAELNKVNLPQSSNFIVEVDFYDDGADEASAMVGLIKDPTSTRRVGLGVHTPQSKTHYVYRTVSEYVTTFVPRARGWHKFGIKHTFQPRRWVVRRARNRVEFFIDDVPVGAATQQFPSAAWFIVSGSCDGGGSFYVDDLRVRPCVSPEPVVSVGAETRCDANSR